MKHLRLTTFVIILALLALMVALPVAAQDEEEDLFPMVGTLTFTEDGDIVFTTLDGTPYIVAPAGSFNPSAFKDYEEGTLFSLDGILLNEGDYDEPGTIMAMGLEEYDEETDNDEDGVPDLEDNCPGYPNPIPEGAEAQVDTDEDGIGDECDEFPDVMDDFDNDGVTDEDDNCPDVYNPDQLDTDDDGIGDACEELEEVDEEEEEEEIDGDGGFYCRNRDIEHPAGGRLAELYEAEYSELIAQFCGDEGTHKVGWGLIRRELRETGEFAERGSRGRGNSGERGNSGNANGRGNSGNANGRGNSGNANGRGNSGGRN